MWFLSFHIHHNAAVTLMKDTEVVLHLEEERLTHEKHDKFPLHALNLIQNYTKVIDYCTYTYLWNHNTDPSVYIKYLNFMCGLSKVVDIREAEPHHSLHASCAFYHSDFDEAVVVVLDGAGSDFHYGKENETIFKMVKNSETPKPEILCQSIVGKQTVKSKFNKPIPKYVNPKQTIGAGMVYAASTQWLGWSGLDCGKTMGLAPYGEPDKNIKPLLTKMGGVPTHFGTMSYEYIDNIGCIVKGYDYISIGQPMASEGDFSSINILSGKSSLGDEELERRRRNFAYKIQKEYEEYLLHLCKKALTISNCKNIVLTGGCALNCVANYKLLKSLPPDVSLFVEPISADCGVSMGAAFNLVSKAYPERQHELKIKDLYLGQQMKYDYKLNDGESEKEVTPKEVAQLLVDGNIVAIAQGRSEAGPRALGNRSILFDPRHPQGKDIVNRVKKREYFRPFAGTVLYEHSREWFDMDRLDESPYMMYAIDVLPEKQEQIPAITHVDGTCRVQTLKKDQNENYYNLISEFHNLTGVPIVFNTSFNLAGDTIVETIDDAFLTLRNSEIEYLYLPEIKKLITVPNNL